LVGVLGIGHDITEHRAYQEQLGHAAHFDNLTGLPNGVLLADRLHQGMVQARLAILNGILGLASAFRRQTIAEGVEVLE